MQLPNRSIIEASCQLLSSFPSSYSPYLHLTSVALAILAISQERAIVVKRLHYSLLLSPLSFSSSLSPSQSQSFLVSIEIYYHYNLTTDAFILKKNPLGGRRLRPLPPH